MTPVDGKVRIFRNIPISEGSEARRRDWIKADYRQEIPYAEQSKYATFAGISFINNTNAACIATLSGL
ncbi:MAG TPA: hypothetical protein PLV51_05735 [Lentimicrobium sp.]|jgi:hypothetical protein|nr:hypothetical protein [Lentimicrobium sp.]